MGKVGGERNFGFGKQMAWAGAQAVADRYGDGHYASAAAHAARWGQFAAWARANDIRDARAVTVELVTAYGVGLAEQVADGELAVAYAQNLLSTVNVVMAALRGDDTVRVSPAALVGQRGNVRTTAPAGLDRAVVERAADALRARGEMRVAAVVTLARDLGMRVREASMLDARAALAAAMRCGAVNITAGTKGGRGNRVDRRVPVSERAMATLHAAAKAQGADRNLIPGALDWRQWNDHLHRAWAAVRGAEGLGRLHDLRAAYACDRYRQCTGVPAPVLTGARLADLEADRAARALIAAELGHGRAEVVAAYVGSAR